MQEHPLVAGLAVTIALMSAALAFLIYRVRSSRRLGAVAGSHYQALVDQSPNGVLVVCATSLKVIVANSAFQRGRMSSAAARTHFRTD